MFVTVPAKEREIISNGFMVKTWVGLMFASLCVFCSESSGAPDPEGAEGHGGQHLRGGHQVPADLLPVSAGVCAGLTDPVPCFYPSARY